MPYRLDDTRRSAHTLSVIDHRRPELAHHDANGSYTLRKPRVPKVSFSLGWELEANKEAVRVPEGVERISDGSVNGDSAEYVVLPTLVKSPQYVLGLLKDLVHSPRLNTDESCGFHVHLAPRGVSLPMLRKWALFCQMLAHKVEASAFKAVPNSRSDNQYCRVIRPLSAGDTFGARKCGNDNRYQWLNVVEMFRPGGIRTVEVRLLGNTHRWKYLSAWVLFCLALGSEAWRVLHDPLDVQSSIETLTFLLNKIENEIKPLARSAESIPPWVYNGLEVLGINTKAWERPLSKIIATEYTIRGVNPPAYSDRQPTIECEPEEDNNSCECGCGTYGRCNHQAHDRGDCDPNICSWCCENGNCDGLPNCEICRNTRHENGEYCEATWCRICRNVNRTPVIEGIELPLTEEEALASSQRSLHFALEESR